MHLWPPEKCFVYFCHRLNSKTLKLLFRYEKVIILISVSLRACLTPAQKALTWQFSQGE